MRIWPLAPAAVLAFALATSPAPADDIDANASYRPDPSSTEAGLWMLSDKTEQAVQASPLLVRDTALNAYVHGVVCKLAGSDCSVFRVYVVENPTMNAQALPNGAIIVFTGLLLRMQNEAQFSFVLGHEMTHYYKRHVVKIWSSMRGTANVLAMIPTLGPLVFLTVGMNRFMAFSREQESEADEGGFQRATAAGYDPSQAPAIWQMMAVEDKADPHREKPGIWGSSHPTDEQRLAALGKRAAEIESQRTAWIVGTDSYRSQTAPFLQKWLDDEMGRGNGWESAVVLERMVSGDPKSGVFRYYLGEAYRHRAKDGDVVLATDTLKQAVACADAPPQAWRDLGLIAMKAGIKQDAQTDFAKYLSLAPNADDRTMIQFYQTQMGTK